MKQKKSESGNPSMATKAKNRNRKPLIKLSKKQKENTSILDGEMEVDYIRRLGPIRSSKDPKSQEM
jgi:hypothetical protein